jgi:hypothetical protein
MHDTLVVMDNVPSSQNVFGMGISLAVLEQTVLGIIAVIEDFAELVDSSHLAG